MSGKHLHTDLGNRRRGEIVEVSLSGNAANVLLLDSANYNNYRNGRRYRYYGGLARRSPVTIQVPRTGRWHVVIDMGGFRGSVRAGVKVLPGALPPISDIPLADVPSLFRHVRPVASEDERPTVVDTNNRRFDVFVSHASDDKDAVVRPLAQALRNAGLAVWYDEFELGIGDSLRRKIDRGLASSRFGIVVISPSFFKKGWTNYELDGLVTRATNGEQVLLPIWHNVTKQEVIDYSPSLADKVARSTATHTIEEIAAEIAEAILGGPNSDEEEDEEV